MKKNHYYSALGFAMITQMITAQVLMFHQSMIVWMVVFNNNANDASLNANNGTVTGATLTTDRFGKANLLI
jgi:K+-transporting ATPase c subunit